MSQYHQQYNLAYTTFAVILLLNILFANSS